MNCSERFQDNQTHIYDLIDLFLVECPQCQSCAKVLLTEHQDEQKRWLFAARKLICTKCPINQLWRDSSVSSNHHQGQDWYFQLPLWLRVDCCGHTLYAHNERHLDLLEDYIKARLRPRSPYHPETVVANLLNWIKSAKNRDELLKAIVKMRIKLAQI